MIEIYRELASHLASGDPVATVTVVRRQGSTPRETGASMLVGRSGLLSGTIGGGAAEAEICRQARECLENTTPRLIYVDLRGNSIEPGLGICGGKFDAFVKPWSRSGAESGHAQSMLVATIVDHLAHHREVTLATVIAAEGALATRLGEQWVVDPPRSDQSPPPTLGADLSELIGQARTGVRSAGLNVAVESGGDRATVFVELLRPPDRLVIVGAGHIGLTLAKMAATVGFSVTVIDDRPEFVTPERFPDADQLISGAVDQALRDLPLDLGCHLVLLTRGFNQDVLALREVLDRPLAYLGLIGSVRRVFTVFRELHREGVGAERLSAIHGPVGLDLGGQTPAEIAVEILAELLKTRTGASGRELSSGLRPGLRARLQKAAARQPGQRR